MKTIEELEKYLEDNCYSFLEISIGKYHAPEGIVIEENEGKFQYSYSERGQKRIIKSFEEESDLVEYALAEIQKSRWANAHIVAKTFDEQEILEAEKILRDMKIIFRRNDDPHFKAGKPAYRIFVFGKDILKLENFKKKYLHTLQ